MSGGPRATGAEIERALAEAEAVLAETTRRRTRLSVAASLLCLGTAVVLLAAVAIAVRLPHAAGIAIALLAAGGALAGLSTGLRRVAAGRREIRERERAMVTAVNYVREVYPLVAARESWTGPDREAVRARVARFPIAAR
ncbi:hypothetical protein AB0J86_31390 [Micromonospora sp. NPDC049559]|uniref:hypothetical protein n=1 Tax=Micromonospora sp. NPDC049559 TaxID=3155923 RepID=UPI003426C0CF